MVLEKAKAQKVEETRCRPRTSKVGLRWLDPRVVCPKQGSAGGSGRIDSSQRPRVRAQACLGRSQWIWGECIWAEDLKAGQTCSVLELWE